MIHDLREQNPEFTITQLTGLFEIKRSSYYYGQQNNSAIKSERKRLQDRATALFKESRCSLGSRSLSAKLRAEGEDIGRYKARSLMREAELESKQPGKHRYRQLEHESHIASNLLKRAFNVAEPNQVWCGDVTYIWSGKEWLYLALVIDLYARRIIGWACSRHPDTQLTGQALKLAYEARGQPKNVMFHSDQGCHYTSKAYQAFRAIGFKLTP